jgi:hypothetical protein
MRGLFVDEESGKWLYPQMQREEHGLLVAKIAGFGARMTLIAFHNLEIPPCMVVAEAHYLPEPSKAERTDA